MKHITIEDIRLLAPDHDPNRYMPDGWSGTLVDLLKLKTLKSSRRVWIVIRLVDDITNLMFADKCCFVIERYERRQSVDEFNGLFLSEPRNAPLAAHPMIYAICASFIAAFHAPKTDDEYERQVEDLRELLSE